MKPVAIYRHSTGKLRYPMQPTPQGRAIWRYVVWFKNDDGERIEEDLRTKSPVLLRDLSEQIIYPLIENLNKKMPDATDMGWEVWKWR